MSELRLNIIQVVRTNISEIYERVSHKPISYDFRYYHFTSVFPSRHLTPNAGDSANASENGGFEQIIKLVISDPSGETLSA